MAFVPLEELKTTSFRPLVFPTAQQLVDREEKISATPQTFLQKLVATSKPIKKVVDVVGEKLFGRGQDVDIAGQLKFDTGAMGFLRPFGIGKPQAEKVSNRIDLLQPLVDSGEITPQRVEEIVQGVLAPSSPIKRIQGGLPVKKPKLALTSSEKKALRPVVIEETLDKVFGVLDFVTLGTIKPLTRVAAQKIADSQIAKDIANILSKEIPELPKEAIDTFSRVLVNIDNADDVQRVLNRTRVAAQQAEKTRTASRKFQIIEAGGKTRTVDGEPVELMDGVETFLRKGDGGWVVSEATTGRFLSESASKEGAIAKAQFNIDQVGKDKFLELIKKHQLAVSAPVAPKSARTAPITPKVDTSAEFAKLPKETRDMVDELIAEGKSTPAEIGAALWISPKTVVAREIQIKTFPLATEARKYKSAEEFAQSITDSSAGAIGRTYDGLPTTNRPITDFNLETQKIGKVNRTQSQTSPDSVAKWVKKIKGGERPPIVVREGMSPSQEWIMDGHNRLAAYQQLGFKEVPTITKSQLTDFWNKVTKPQTPPRTRTSEKAPAQTPRAVPPDTTPPRAGSLDDTVPQAEPERNLPVVIRGDTFQFSSAEITSPTMKERKVELKATQKEIQNAEKAEEKAQKLVAGEQKVREEAMKNIQRFRGNTDLIIENLKSKNLSDEDIANIVLEDGTKLIDTAKVKRNQDGTLAAVIRKSELEHLKKSYTDELPKEKWEKRSMLVDGIEVPIKAARSIELPYVWFERKGLNAIYEPIIQAGRDAEVMKNLYLQRFKDAGLFKEGGWFTADRFNISKGESENIARYYLTRQGKDFKTTLEQLSPKEKKFVEIFDSIIADTEPRFFETAKKNGKAPTKVENYAPIMTSNDFKLIDKGGSMDWLFRNHPAFFSLKERVERVPKELYELDYREVASRWLDGVTDFLNYGETVPRLKYLVNSEQFGGIVKETDQQFISNWLRDVTTKENPASVGGQALNSLSKLLRKGVAIASLGLNYASVLKQALTQIPLMIISKTRPKLQSEYARAFGVDVSKLPSITKRRGDIAIQDLQGKIGRIFTGALTQFDKKNAQLSLNGLLDKEYSAFLKDGAEITPETRALIEKRAQDTLDMWYGGFFKGQRPEAFRKELGNFILMFLYPLTSQLNGFFRHILRAKGSSKVIAGAEVLAAATVIAYMEQTVTNLSFEWSDEEQMTKDVLNSLLGNIPIAGNIAFALSTDSDFQISPVLGNFNNILRKIEKGEGLGWALAETFGLPKQVRRIKEGMEIMDEGGITDDNGKMLAPVQDTIELVRSFLRGKYGSLAAQDWIRNIGEKKEDRRWFIPQVEFLQNGDYDRKAELYKSFSEVEQKELRDFLSENQQKKLDKALGGKKGTAPAKSSFQKLF